MIGTLISEADVSEANDCLSNCKSQHTCNWFTYDEDLAPNCKLYEDCDTLDKTCTNCLLGEAECGE